MKELNIKFPAGFLFSTGNSAFQSEGKLTTNDFYDFALSGGIANGSTPENAVMHYDKFRDDIEQLANLPTNAIKLSLEWARIEPEPGKYNEEAIHHYKEVLHTIKNKNMKIILALHHFSNPKWLWSFRAWENSKVIYQFEKYLHKVVEPFYDLVDYWIPINEPNYYAAAAYFLGELPPGKKKSIILYLQVLRNMAVAHVKAYNYLRNFLDGKGYKDVKVMTSLHYNLIEPLRQRSFLDQQSARFIRYFFLSYFINKITAFNGGIIPLDMIGIDYHSRDYFSFPFNYMIKAEGNISDNGWEIFPQGIFRVCEEVYNKYKLPIFITENGICDIYDSKRPAFIISHLYWLHKAIRRGIPIKGYSYWTNLDNFMLVQGILSRFGLIYVDHRSEDKKRTVKRSGELYGKICEYRGFNKDIIMEYAPEIFEHLN